MSERETALKEPCPHCGRTDYRWTNEFRVGLSFSPEDRLEVRCDYCRPLRMDAYYYGFSETGVLAIDRILSAVAQAGKKALAALPPGDAPQTCAWREIATAPKDGTAILLYVADERGSQWANQIGVWWDDGEAPGFFRYQEDQRRLGAYSRAHQPTHWQPLPAPPVALVPAEGEK